MLPSNYLTVFAHMSLLVSAWAWAQAPIAAVLNVSWDPWTNFTGFSDAGVLAGTCGGFKCI